MKITPITTTGIKKYGLTKAVITIDPDKLRML